MRTVPLFLIVPLLGCAPTREPAPEDLDGLLHYIYRNYEDPEALHEAMDNLGPWLDTVGRTEEAREGWRVTPLVEEDVATITHPDDVLEEAMGVAVAGVSAFPIEPHAEITLLHDQEYNDPRGYSLYARTIYEGDPDAFLDGSDAVRTVNDIDKTKVGVTIPYVLYKDFAWVHFEDGQRAVVARSWIEEGSCSPNGNNCLDQSFSVDLWYASDEVDTVRMTATWNEIHSIADAILTEDQLVNIAVNGMLEIYENTDTYLETY